MGIGIWRWKKTVVRLDSVAPTMVTVGLCCVMVGSLTQHNGTRGRREWRGGRNGSLLCNLTLFALWKETPGDTWRREERRERLVFVFLRGWALCVAEKIQPVGRQTREERKVNGQVEIWKKAKADWQANMQRDEADSQPTLLAVSGVCGLIQANSRTVSEDGRLFLAAFHTDRTQKQWAGEKSYLQENQRISVYKAFLQQPNRKMWGRENTQTEWKIEFPFSLCYLLILFALWPFLHPVLTSC